jgi:hypothetical protein
VGAGVGTGAAFGALGVGVSFVEVPGPLAQPQTKMTVAKKDTSRTRRIRIMAVTLQ